MDQATPAMSDAALVALAQQGCSDAFAALTQRYLPRFLKLAYELLGDEEEAADAVQESLFKAYTRLAHFEGRASFSSWLCQIVRFHCYDLLRRRRCLRVVSLDAPDEWDERKTALDRIADPETTPETIVLQQETQAAVHRAVDRLSPRFRQVMRLYLEDLPCREIARRLGCPARRVNVYLSLARRQMQMLLAEQAADLLAAG